MSVPLERLLGTSGEDSGCEGGMELLSQYAEAELDSRDAAELFPTLAEHMRNCPACEEDYTGVVALLRSERA